MGTRRYLAVLVDIYVVNEVDGFNGNPKGSEAATWKPKNSQLQKPQLALRNPGEDKILTSKKSFHLEPERCEALISNRFQPFLNQRPSDAFQDAVES